MPSAASEPEMGSPAWYARRRALWDHKAQGLLADLKQYEDEHPEDAICLQAVLEAARHGVTRA